MNAFVASPPINAPATPIDDVVPSDGWYPSIKISETREILALTTAVTDVRLRDAIQGAMLSVGRPLAIWQTVRILAGALDMASAGVGIIEQQRVADGARLVLLYQRAVRAYAAAELVDLEGQISATDGGRDRAEAALSPADHHRRLATHAIRDILGKGRTKVRLV